MARYIKESDIYKLFDESNGIVRLHVAQIDELPRADVEEVVRCKDCLFMKQGYRDTYFCSAQTNANFVHQEHFCSYGKRKEDISVNEV